MREPSLQLLRLRVPLLTGVPQPQSCVPLLVKLKSQPFSFLRVPQLKSTAAQAALFQVSSRRVPPCVRVPCLCVRPRAHAAGGEGLPAAGTARRVVQQQPADCMLSCQLSAAVSLRAAEPARFFICPESLAELPRPKRLEVSELLTLEIAKVPAARKFSRGPRPGGLSPGLAATDCLLSVPFCFSFVSLSCPFSWCFCSLWLCFLLSRVALPYCFPTA